MTLHRTLSAAALLLAATPAAAQQRPAVRPLGPVVATSAQPFAGVAVVRHVPGGVLVNDPVARRIVWLDSSLASARVVIDSGSGANAYGPRFAGLLAYRGDSSLFVDAASLSMLVLDPSGNPGRVMSVPRSQDAIALAAPGLGLASFDAQGRLVYRQQPRFDRRMMASGTPGGAPPAPPAIPDSAPVVRIDLATRQLDTLAFVKTQRPNVQITQDADGKMVMRSEINPLPTVDDWAVLTDGSVAIVRGRDYHIDWVRPDGSRASGAKLPFEWKRLSDEEKVAFIDSLKAARERQLAAAPAGAAPGAGSAAAGGAPGAAVPQVQATIVMGGGPGAGGEAVRGGQMISGPAQVTFVAPSELPDYRPAFFAGAARADAAGNLWIRTTESVNGALIYDVVNTKGDLVDRVQVPAGRTLVGFGTDGSVYLTAREGANVILERARLR